MDKQLKQLAALAQMVKDAELLRYSQAVAKCRDLDAAREKLQTVRRSAIKDATVDYAHLSGQAELWHIWVVGELTQSSTRMALAAAEEEKMRKAAARAAGRADALARLAGRK